jgi:hypothetical protein
MIERKPPSPSLARSLPKPVASPLVQDHADDHIPAIDVTPPAIVTTLGVALVLGEPTKIGDVWVTTTFQLGGGGAIAHVEGPSHCLTETYLAGVLGVVQMSGPPVPNWNNEHESFAECWIPARAGVGCVG